VSYDPKVTPTEKRDRRGAGSKARQRIAILTERRDFLRALTESRKAAGQGASLQFADAERLTWILDTLTSEAPPPMTVNQRTAARKMISDRMSVLRAILEQRPPMHPSVERERREMKAWEWVFDELAKRWAAEP
jgi:hypothetical protein